MPGQTSHSTIPNSAEPNSPIILVNLSNCKTLTPLTYLSWSSQITSLLYGLDLLGFVDGTHPAPAANTKGTDGKETPNPAAVTWSRQDRLILSALLGTLDDTIAPLVFQAETSHQAWTILKTTYANPSRGHILQVKHHLDSITQASLPITQYMQAIKTSTDKLAILGKPMDPEDIISKVLKGLDYEAYKPVVDSVRARDNPISFEDLHEKLINHELSLKQSMPPPNSLPYPVSAHVAQTHQYGHTRTNTNPPILPTPLSRPSQPANPFKGKCQYCRIVGHVISQCRQFKRDYPMVVFPSPPTSNRSSRPQAHTATMSSAPPSVPWLVDSGATNHITNDLSTLALHHPYNGSDDIIIGDGSSLPISNIGSLDTPGSSSRHT